MLSKIFPWWKVIKIIYMVKLFLLFDMNFHNGRYVIFLYKYD